MFTDEEWATVQKIISKFNTSQQLWLSGYLARAGGAEPLPVQGAAEPVATERLLIAFGGETGNCQQLANQLLANANNIGINAQVVDMAKLKLRQLGSETVAIFICSTHGDGDPPETMQDFYDELKNAKNKPLTKLQYSVLALGDTSYDMFCQTGKDLDAFLERAGAKRVKDRLDCDVDFEKPAATWLEEALKQARILIPEQTAAITTTAAAPAVAEVSKANPATAEVVEMICLSHPSRKESNWHVEVLTEEGIDIAPGDAIGIFPKNDDALVTQILEGTGLSGDEAVELKGKKQTVGEALAETCDLVMPNKGVLEKWAAWSESKELKDIVESDAKAQRAFLKSIQIKDLVASHPVKPGAQDFVDCLRPLQPRLYDIANFEAGSATEFHLLVKNYQYWFNSRIETGVASAYFAGLQAGDKITFYPHRNHKFHLPEDPQQPLILIAAGTGIAPYRAFLNYFSEMESRPPIWIVFQEKLYEEDFLYQTEWQDALSDGRLKHFDGVFVSDSPGETLGKTIRRQKERLQDWLIQGAHIYLCGDRGILTDCEHDIVACLGDFASKNADTWNDWKQLDKGGRIHRNLY